MSERLSPERIAATDPGGLVDDVLALPHQLADALWRVESAAPARAELEGGVCVLGPGEWIVGADIAAAIVGERARRPLRGVRGGAPEPWATGDTLALCVSYSGDDAAAIDGYAAAERIGMRRAVVTTGGALAARARADGVPVVGVPSGLRARTAIAYVVVATIELAAAIGAGAPLRGEIEAAAGAIERLAADWGPAAAAGSPAKSLALRLDGLAPVVLGDHATIGLARRWALALAANARLPAFAVEVEDAPCTWADGLAGILIGEGGTRAPVGERVALAGASPTERQLAALLLGDLVSVYAAVLRGVDPAS